MYSVVLMMAMTTGGDVPAAGFTSCYGGCGGGFFNGLRAHKECKGCNGCFGCHGCNGCGGLFSKHGCHGCTGCNGCGGLFSKLGCKGCHGCHGCTGCNGCHGCHGCNGCGGLFSGLFRKHRCCGCNGHVVTCDCAGAVIVEKKEEEKEEEKEEMTEESDDAAEGENAVEAAAPAKIIVTLPADATLTIDDAATKATSARRVFTSPKLPAGKVFTYTLKAQFEQNGEMTTVTKVIEVRAGQTTRVSFAAANVAAR
jgi:uncharacterized protein (TIGR03000 family)